MSRSLRIAAVALLTILFCDPCAWTQATVNLAQQGLYADPEIHLYAGQYWIYPTASLRTAEPGAHAAFNPQQQTLRGKSGLRSAYLFQTYLDALSSPDLAHWTRHAHVLDVRNIAWAAYAVWAPSALHLNGKYYLFFSANDIQASEKGPGGIGVAVSDSPSGPFVDVLGKPLIGEFHNGAQPIDPDVFQDDDGTIYLYYGGQGHCNVVRLAPDLKSVLPFEPNQPNGAAFQEVTPESYVEAPFMFKRKGLYYLMWSEGDWGNGTYGVAYAHSTSPTGPFQRIEKILVSNPRIATGPGHNSVLHIPGTDDWYIVYHRHPLGTTDANERTLAIDRMYFDADGGIAVVRMTKFGAAPRPIARSARNVATP